MYTSYYGFSAKPFQLSPDPRFFFGSSAHKRALAYLRYGLSQGEGFIVVTGNIGTGKTTLVRSLFQELDSRSVLAAQLVTTQLGEDDLLRMVVAAFELPHEGLSKASLLKQFETFLRERAGSGQRVLLVVDEAQNLPARSLEELRMLSNFQVSESPLMQSFLLGQEEFRSTLRSPCMEQLRQRVIASCHLDPLDTAETREYVEHRLRVVGWQERPRFSDEAYGAIHRCTGGIPRQVNIFCDRVLLFGFLEGLQQIDEAHIATVAREFTDSVASPSMVTSARVPGAAASNDLDVRIAELERAVASLRKSPVLPALERRVAELEPAVDTLREGFTLLVDALKRPQSAEVER